jgi:hypothetical protein
MPLGLPQLPSKQTNNTEILAINGVWHGIGVEKGRRCWASPVSEDRRVLDSGHYTENRTVDQVDNRFEHHSDHRTG